MRIKNYFILVIFMVCVFPVFPASNVSVSPDSLSSDQGAWLTLNADVASGSDVHITMVVDFNGDGIRNGSDFALQYFKVKEGVAPVKPESPKPGDEDGENAHLLTHIDMWNHDHFAGNFIIEVEDSGDMASDTFLVTQPTLSQSVSGTLNNHTGNPTSGIIGARDWQGKQWFAVTNSNGTYKIYLPAGNVEVSGYILGNITDFDGQGSQSFLLHSGENKTGVNLQTLWGNYGVLGVVRDVTNSQGVRNILVSAEGDGKFSISLTDFAGNFYFALTNGSWDIGVDGSDCNQRGLAGQNFREAVINNGGVTDFYIDLYQADSYITGNVKKIKDSSPLAGYEVRAEVDAQGFVSGYSRGPDGSYVLLVHEADWRVGIDQDDVRIGGFIQPSYQIVHPLPGNPETGIDFLLSEPDSIIQITVREKVTENPVSDVGAYAMDEVGNYYGLNDKTDADGNLVFPVVAGSYQVGLNSLDLFPRDYAIPSIIDNVTLLSSETKQVLFEIEKAGAFINGSLYFNASPVRGINIALMDESFEWLANAETLKDGTFHIPVKEGTYHVQPDGSQLMGRNIAPVAAQEVSLTSGALEILYDLVPPDATLRIYITGEGTPLRHMDAFLKESLPGEYSLARLLTDSSGYATFKVVAGTYSTSINHDQVMAYGFLPKSDRIASVATGQIQDVFFWLHPYESRTALDALILTVPFDEVERMFLDFNHDGKLDVADILSLIIKGK